MNAQLEQFAAEVRQDEALIAEFQQITDADALVARALELAHERGYDAVTEDDVRTFMDQSQKAPLSNAELDEIAGGTFTGCTFSGCGGGGG